MTTRLRLPKQNRETVDFPEIQRYLRERGVSLTRWNAASPLKDEASQDEILKAYAHEIEPFMKSFSTRIPLIFTSTIYKYFL